MIKAIIVAALASFGCATAARAEELDTITSNWGGTKNITKPNGEVFCAGV